MNHSIKVASDGQVTLPEDVRKALNVEAGGTLDLIENGEGRFELRPKGPTFADLRGIVKLDGPVTTEELDRWVADARGRLIEGDDHQ